MIDSLINHPTVASRNLDSLAHINLGGSVVHPEVYKKCRVPPLSVKTLTSAFGMTEGSLLTSWDTDARQPDYKDVISVGTAAPGTKIRICEPGTKQLVAWGGEGELHLGNPYIYKGFPGREEDWLYAEDEMKWIMTGDQASLGEQGELYILGRYKDLIIRGGRNISPAAIEAVLNVLPGVSALVVGLPDDVAGELPVAVVMYSDDTKYSDRDIRNTVTSALGQHASPQRVTQLQDLGLQQFPLTAAGKPDKKRLAAPVAEHEAKQGKDESVSLSNGVSNDTTTQRVVTEIWAELSAQSPDEIPIRQPVTEFADSLLVLQATSLMEKRTKKPITVEDILGNPTIEQQVQLLDRREPKSSIADTTHSSRAGPPSASEIAHVRNSPERFDETKMIVGRALSKFDSDWNDVEDVLPYYDNGRFMLESSRRLQSWCHRFAFAADVSVEAMRQALIESLRHHPMFRSIAVKYEEETWLHVVLRLFPGWIDQAIMTTDGVISEAALPLYRLNDAEFDHADKSGLLFRAAIIPLKGGTSSGVVMNINHSMYDALSTSLWLDDLNLCLNGDPDLRPSRVSYKLFADAYYFGRHGAVSRNSCDFLVHKLRGCGEDKRAQWPVQRARGWFMGEAIGWRDEAGRTLDPSSRSYVDAESERYGHKGFNVNVKVTGKLQTQHNISLVALFKAAVAIFNAHETGAGFALFSHWEAGRMFPYLEDNPTYTSMLPNSMDIAGATGQRIVNKINVSPKEKILDLLVRVQEDVTATSRHAHAPLFEIKKIIASTSETDAEVFYKTFQRQIFNWVPQVPALSKFNADKSLRKVQQLPHGDAGFVWTGLRTDRNTVARDCGGCGVCEVDDG